MMKNMMIKVIKSDAIRIMLASAIVAFWVAADLFISFVLTAGVDAIAYEYVSDFYGMSDAAYCGFWFLLFFMMMTARLAKIHKEIVK